MPNRSRTIRATATLGLSLACLVALGWGIDLDEARDALATVRWRSGIPLLVTLLITHALRSWRYGVLVGAGVSARRLFSVCAVGFLAIQVIPLRLGEFVRPTLLARDGIPFGAGLAGVVLERFLDLLMVAGLIAMMVFVWPPPSRGLGFQGVDVVAAARIVLIPLLGIGLVGLVVVAAAGPALARALSGLPRIAANVASVAAAIRQLAAHPVRALGALAASVGVWGTTVVGVWITLGAFDGVPGTVGAATVIWTLTIVGTVVLPTPGSVGPYEAACVGSLLLYGTDPDVARTFAVVLHGAQLGFTLALGTVFLVLEGTGLRTLVEDGHRDDAHEGHEGTDPQQGG